MSNIRNLIEKSYKVIDINGFENQKTFFFEIGKKELFPGQFYMFNYNGSQKPFSISHYDGEIIGFTIQKRGTTSDKIVNELKIGDYVGLTGPIGKSFNLNKDNYLLIGGGIGSAPIYFLANYIIALGKKCYVLMGARNICFLEYTYNLKNNSGFIKYFTDDGSSENKGFVTDGIDEIIINNKIDTVSMCGPEKMMKIAGEKIRQSLTIPIEISMERYMKCGIGICGSCVLDDIGLRVCVDGPVFDYDTVRQSKEFSNYHRNSGGIIEKF